MKIGILDCYFLNGDKSSYQADYAPMCKEFSDRYLISSKTQVYQVGMGEMPPSTDVCDLWLLTGSSASVYDEGSWIKALVQFIKKCDRERRPMVGYCFGHQMIALALGGSVKKSPKGWGVGVREFKVLDCLDWMKPQKQDLSLIYSHQDQVVQLPSRALHLGESSFCSYEMFSIDNHIFCVQGHPEFSPDFAKSRYLARKDMLGEGVFFQGMDSVDNPTDASVVWKWVQNIMDRRA